MSNLSNNRIYPNASPEFRLFNKQDGTMEMQVRYRNDAIGYLGKWMPVNTVQEQPENV